MQGWEFRLCIFGSMYREQEALSKPWTLRLEPFYYMSFLIFTSNA
jgi:hypothetical protein